MLSMRDLIPWTRGREVPGERAIEHPLVMFQREMDRLFEEFRHGFDLPTLTRGERIGGYLAPRIDVSEKDDEIIVSAELPGLEEKDVDVTLTDNVLLIRGEKKQEKEERSAAIHTPSVPMALSSGASRSMPKCWLIRSRRDSRTASSP